MKIEVKREGKIELDDMELITLHRIVSIAAHTMEEFLQNPNDLLLIRIINGLVDESNIYDAENFAIELKGKIICNY